VIAAGTVLFAEGEPADTVYQLISGRIELTRQTRDGPIRLAELGPGELVGELDVLDHLGRNATARTLVAARVRAWPAQVYLSQLTRHPEALLALLRTAAKRWRRSNELLSAQEAAPPAPSGFEAATAEPPPSPERPPAPEPEPSPPAAAVLLPPARTSGRLKRRQAPSRRTLLQFQPDAVEIEDQPLPPMARAIVVTLVLFLGAGVLWASLAQLDRIVIAEGKLVTRAPKILIQPLETMVVRSVEVRAGQVVAAGEVLAHLDPTFAEADRLATQGTITSLSARIARLRAETGLSPVGRFSDDPVQEALQHQVFDTDASDRQAQLQVNSEDVQELSAHLQTVRQDYDKIKGELAVLTDLVSIRRQLFEQGNGSKVLWLDAQRQLLNSQRESERLANNLIETEHRLKSAAAKREGLINEWRTKDMHELMDAMRDLAKVSEEAKKYERLRRLVEMTAPDAGVVLEVAPRTPGSVIRQGDTLITLVPLGGQIDAEVSVRPQDISHVRPHDSARIKLETLPFQKYGTADGWVSTISEDIFEEEAAGRKTPLYRVQLAVDASRLRDLPHDFRLIPGMAVTAEIKVGTRSLISYFFYPILRTLDAGLREP